ncbi:MAG TPA: hypothetical protein VGL83_00875 [Stellaceae bacterium]|jgi:hypothetical protein
MADEVAIRGGEAGAAAVARRVDEQQAIAAADRELRRERVIDADDAVGAKSVSVELALSVAVAPPALMLFSVSLRLEKPTPAPR